MTQIMERRERRVRRSDVTDKAMAYQLEACVERAGLTAMVVSDDQGLLVAASPWERQRSETVAAMLPLVARGHDAASGLLDEGANKEQVLVSSFDADGVELYICAVGGFDEQAHREVARAKVGISRILA